MQSKFKWLFVPPAIALVLFLGPLQSGSIGETPTPSESSMTTRTPEPGATRPGSALPAMPGMWRIASTLVGVLLLGAVGIAVLKRAQQGRPGAGGTTDIVRLRQSLRLSPKNSVHALEFDGALLLVGECDGKLGVLQAGTSTAELDERTIAERAEAMVDDDDDGVVLRDMVIPRPSQQKRATAPRDASSPTPDAATAAKLAHFKNLLVKAGSAR